MATARGFNQKTVEEFYAKAGRGIGRWGDHLLLMVEKGALSGQEFITPLVFRRLDGRYVVVASRGGAPEHPRWYHNVQVNPVVQLEVPAENGIERLQARATAIPRGPERDRLYAFMTEVWPAFADYQQRTDRTIPVVVLDPIA